METAEQTYMTIQKKYEGQFGAIHVPEDWHLEAMQAYSDQETEKALENIIEDIDFGYNADMIKGKILNGSYR